MKRKHITTSLAAMPNAGMAAVAGMIADPTDFPVIRKSGTYSTMPTATAKPYVREAITWNPTATADALTGLAPTDWGGFIFRNPLRAAVIYKRYPMSSPAYSWQFNPVANELGELVTAGSETYVSPQETKNLEPYGATPSALNTYNPHGNILFAGEDDNYRYLWIDGDGTNSYIVFQFLWDSATTSAGSRTMWIYKWDGGLRRLVTTADSGAIGNTTVTVNLPVGGSKSGYYTVTVRNGDTAPAKLKVTTTSANQTDFWAHYTVGQLTGTTLSGNIAGVNDVRVLAANILVQNKAGPLTKQGKSVICQALKNEDWYSFYGDGQVMYDRISSNPSSRSFNWEDGIYGFLKPTGESDLDYIIPFVTTGSSTVIEDVVYKLIQSDYIAFCVSATADGAGDAQFTFSHALEFRTRNQWLEKLPPSISSDEWESGVQAVISMEQFYHNPIHWAKIFSTIGKIARVGAPLVAKFGPYGALAGSVMGIIGEALK